MGLDEGSRREKLSCQIATATHTRSTSRTDWKDPSYPSTRSVQRRAHHQQAAGAEIVDPDGFPLLSSVNDRACKQPGKPPPISFSEEEKKAR